MNCLLLILVFLASNRIAEETHGSIVGYVQDSIDRKPINGVIVEILDIEKKTISDDKGGFEIQAIPPGTYDLYFIDVRYKPYKLENVEVKSEEKTRIHILLTKYDREKTFTLIAPGIGDPSTQCYLKIVKPDSSIDYKILELEPDSSIDYKIIISDPKK